MFDPWVYTQFLIKSDKENPNKLSRIKDKGKTVMEFGSVPS